VELKAPAGLHGGGRLGDRIRIESVVLDEQPHPAALWIEQQPWSHRTPTPYVRFSTLRSVENRTYAYNRRCMGL
jgi:hypothetical protein